MNACIDTLVKTTAEEVERTLETQEWNDLTFTATVNEEGEIEMCGDWFPSIEEALDQAQEASEWWNLGDCVASDEFDLDHDPDCPELFKHVVVTFTITDGQVSNVSSAVRTTRKELAQWMLNNGAVLPECEDLDELDEPEAEPSPKRARHVIDLTAE